MAKYTKKTIKYSQLAGSLIPRKCTYGSLPFLYIGVVSQLASNERLGRMDLKSWKKFIQTIHLVFFFYYTDCRFQISSMDM